MRTPINRAASVHGLSYTEGHARALQIDRGGKTNESAENAMRPIAQLSAVMSGYYSELRLHNAPMEDWVRISPGLRP